MPRCICESNEDVLELVRLTDVMGEEAAIDFIDLDESELEELRLTQAELELSCDAAIHFPSLLDTGFDLPPLPDAGRAKNDEREQSKLLIQHSKFGPFSKEFGPAYKRDNRRF